VLHREGRHRAGAWLFLFRGRAGAALSLISVDANGDLHLGGRIVAVGRGDHRVA
jgi:hypothetical protein